MLKKSRTFFRLGCGAGASNCEEFEEMNTEIIAFGASSVNSWPPYFLDERRQAEESNYAEIRHSLSKPYRDAMAK